jgi:hypothetical protein
MLLPGERARAPSLFSVQSSKEKKSGRDMKEFAATLRVTR